MAKVNKVLYNVDQTSGDAALRTTAEERRMARKNVGLYEVIGQATTKDGEGHVIDQGIAPLGTNGLVPVEYLPSFIGSVVNGYYYNEAFYSDPAHTELITPTESSTYVDLTDPDQGRSYRWSDETGKYFLISDQNAFGIITDGTNTKYADRPIDTLKFVGGSGLHAEVSDNGHADTVAFSHTNSVTAKSTADPDTNSIIDGSTTFDIPWIKYDAQGHITGTGSRKHTLYPGRGYGTCDTAGEQKTVYIDNYKSVTGGIVAIKFETDVPANSTLNISGTGAKYIYNNGVKIGSGIILAHNTATFMYDGTRYQLLSVGDAGVKLFTATYDSVNKTLTITPGDYNTMKSRCDAGTLVILKYTVNADTNEKTDHCMYLSYRKSDKLCFYGYDVATDTLETCTFPDANHLTMSIISNTLIGHTHGNIANGGALTDTAAAAAGNDYVVIRDAENSKIQTSTIKGTDVADAVSKKHSHSTLTLSTTAQAYDGTHTLALPADDPYTSARTPSSHAHGNIANDGTLTDTAATAAGNDYVVIRDADNSKIQTSTIKGTDVADAVSKKHSHSTLTLSTTAQAYDGTNTIAMPSSDPYTSARTPSSHTHGNITNDGKLQTTDVTVASGDKLVVTDSSDSSKVARASISFDGLTDTKALSQKGTWESFNRVSMDTVDDQSGSFMKILLSNHPYGGITSVETAVKYATNRDENKNSKWLTYKPSTNTIYANLDGQAKYAEALCHSDGTAREVGNSSTPVYFDSDGIPHECEEHIYKVKYGNVSSNNRCILLSSPASPDSGSAYTVSYNSDLKYNASDGTISASISGNAATATNAANVQYDEKSSGQYMVLLAGRVTITDGSYNPVGYCTQLSLDAANNLLNTNIVGSSGRVRYKTCNNGTVSDSDAGSVTIVKSTDGSIPSSGDYFVFV